MSETFVVRRAAFSIEDPWAIPPQAASVRLRRATDGAPPRLATTVAAYYDYDVLTVVFSSADDHVVATYLEHDAPLYDEDVVEVFLAPRDPSEYFEIEVSPLGTTFDARITSPDGVRSTMGADLAWDATDLFAGVKKGWESTGVMTVDTVIRLPFASLGMAMPRAGDVWKGNFFRIDRHPRGDEFMAWQPTMKTPADFHVTAAFGALRFEG
jgi:Carbohydrate-binding family 9